MGNWNCHIGWLLTVVLGSTTLAAIQNRPLIDVPALVAGCDLNDPFLERPPAGEKLVQITLPISWRLPELSGQRFESCEFEFTWAQSLHPVADYWPKSVLQSPISGVIEIQRQTERKANLGTTTNGILSSIGGSLSAAAELRDTATRHFSELPEATPLITSGTMHRGTGVFFRFFDSDYEQVEGGRDLVLVFRVPADWRGGILQVESELAWKRSGFGQMREREDAAYSFSIPVYLEGDSAARELAMALALAEQSLRSAWVEFTQRATPTNWLETLRATGRVTSHTEVLTELKRLISLAELPELPPLQKPISTDELRTAMVSFSKARSRLLELSAASGLNETLR